MKKVQPQSSRSGMTPSLVTPNPEAGIAAPAVPASSYDLRILQSLRRIIRAVDLHSRRLSMQHNITGPQLAALLAIAEQGAMTASALAKAIYLSPSTIVGILDRLEEKQLISRNRSNRDRRVVHLAITQQGRKLAGSAPSPLQETLAAALQQLPEIEQVSITLALEKIVSLMEAGDIDAAPLLETGPLVSPDGREPNVP